MAPLLHRLTAALFTLPSLQGWLQFGQLCLLCTFVMVPLGWGMGFLKLEVIRSPGVIGRAIATAFFFPALAEELFFRALLLPHPSPGLPPGWLAIGFGLLLFILYHPLNAFTFFPAGRQTFINPAFLLLATLLGMACTLIYLQTGSLWTAILLHWIAVVVWLLLLGGYTRLYSAALSTPT